MQVFAVIASASRLRIGASMLSLSAIALSGCIDLNPAVDACTVTIAPTAITLPVNGRQAVVGTAFDCKGNSIRNEKISFTTANPAIATVSVDGNVIGIAVGETTVSAVADGKTGTATVQVTPEVANAVTVNPTNPTLRVNDVRQFSATLRNAAGTVITGRTVRWSSSNSSVATVNTSGLVTAVAPGSASITAEADQVSGSTGVVVTFIPVKDCTITPGSNKITVSAQVQPSLVVRDSTGASIALQGRPITWQSDNEIVATVSQTGVITARRAGTARITATSGENTSVSCFTTLEAVDARIFAAVIQQRTGSLRIGAPRGLSVALRDSLDQPIPLPRPITWTSVNPQVANVTPQGIVTGIAEGTARIAVNAEGAVDTVSFPVTKIPVGSITLTPLQANITQGSTVQISPEVKDTAGTVVTDRPIQWLSSDPTKATVSATGLVSTTAPGSVQIQAVVEGRFASATVNILPAAVAQIVAPATFVVKVNQQSAFTISLRDANGNQLFNRTISVISDSPSTANTVQFITGTQVSVQGVTVGETVFTIQALNLNNQPEGPAVKVAITVQP